MSLRWIPNAICLVRIVLVAPIVWTLVSEQFDTALVLVIVAGASDGLDGYLAKTFDWRTRLGGLLDPIADKLLITAVFVTLTYLGLVPLLLTVIVILRDFVIVLGALVYQCFVARVEAEPTNVSKLNTACQLGFVVLTITHAAFTWPREIVLTLLGAAVVVTSITSGMNYVVGWSKRAWQARHQAS